MNDRDLRELFGALREEDRERTPDFHETLRAAKTGASVDTRRSQGRPAPWWRAVPVGAALAAAGIGAIALFGAPSPSEIEFQRAVAWTQSDPVFASVRGPSDVLLEQNQWALLKSGTPSRGMMSGLSDMLNLDAGFNDERNES